MRALGRGYHSGMALGTSLFLIAVGAILRYAVSDSLPGVDLPVIGLILMIVGVVAIRTATRTPDATAPPAAAVATVCGRDRGP